MLNNNLRTKQQNLLPNLQRREKKLPPPVLPSHQKIAVVGSSGQGKSTLFNLITRIFDPNKGEIDIDGINIKDLTEVDREDKKEADKALKDVFQMVIYADCIIKHLRKVLMKS